MLRKPRNDILVALETFSQIDLDNDFQEHVLKACQKLEENPNLSSLNTLMRLKGIYRTVSLSNCLSNWQFVSLSLECLLYLKDNLQKETDETEKLLSVAQQRSIRTLLDKVIDVVLFPNLLPGVEPPSLVAKPNEQTLTDIQKYFSLCLVTLVLIDLYHDDILHGLLIPQFLSPILRALCQLTMTRLSKSAETFPVLRKERLIFEHHLDELVTRLYKPMVIKELMVIVGNKKCPKWLKRGVGKLLTDELHQPNGVLAIVQAVRDAANCMAPTTHSHLEAIAQVIAASRDLINICSQILQLLDSKNAELIKAAVLCIKKLHKRDGLTCKTHLLEPMMRPLTCLLSSEQDLTLCLHRLHKCFAVPASDFWCLPSRLLQSHINVLFQLYCKIYQSVSHSRQTVEDLVWCFLSKCDDSVLPAIFRCLLFREKFNGAKMVDGVEFVFGDDGGVKLSQVEESEHSLEKFGDSLIILLERRDTNGLIGNKLFVTLLQVAAEKKDMTTIDSYEQQLLTVKLLAVLSENSAVQKSLCENSEPVVTFLSSMISSFLSNVTREVETISIVLVVLNVILNDFIYSKSNCWMVFDKLVEPLALLKSKTENVELRLLAEEAYEVIMTHGSVKPKQKPSKFYNEENKGNSKSVKIDQNTSDCDQALREACDALLPVRGHAIIQLGKLLAAGDKQARAKKDQILCIFQENLKDEDSFLYLNAIEGLATAAAEFPDTVIISLTEQYCRHSLSPDTRLKVGEALVRVTKLIGELAPVYKAELINAFLSGVRDDDFLVRASSLSNLGELCRVLGFRIGPVVAEVLMCARCVFCSDPAVEVRRAAVMLVYLLLKGLHKDALTVLQDVLLELYHSLKRIYSSDKDDVTRLHAQLALEELNSGTLAFLFPKPPLTKQIVLLDPSS